MTAVVGKESRAGSIKYPEIVVSEEEGRKEEEEEDVQEEEERDDHMVHVAIGLGKDMKEDEKMLIKYALQYSRENKLNKICILHVHQPAKFIPNGFGAKVPPSQMKDSEVRAYRKLKRQEMETALHDNYLKPCRRFGVEASRVYIEMDSIEKGIVELVAQHKIRKLIMGSPPADRGHRSEKLVELKSKKAEHVRKETPGFCQIQFVYKDCLIFTRESSNESISDQSSVTLSQWKRSTSTQEMRSLQRRGQDPRLPKSRSEHLDEHLPHKGAWWANLPFGSLSKSIRRTGSLSPSSSSLSSHSPSPSHLHHVDSNIDININGTNNITAASSNFSNYDENWDLLSSRMRPSALEALVHPKLSDDQLHPSIPSSIGSHSHVLVEELESLYAAASKQRKEAEQALFEERKKFEIVENQRDQVIQELKRVDAGKSSLKIEIEMLQECKKERDEFKRQCDSALRLVEQLTTQLQLREASSSSTSNSILPHDKFVPEFSLAEIQEATKNFDSSLLIGAGGYGSIYRGLLRHTKVAIKTLRHDSSQGLSEFHQEVNVLSKMRHPNIVTLIGACPKKSILIYEYLANGSLEDRLNCKHNTPPLSWETRIDIAIELCSVLIFLHSGKPYIIVHGDLKPANILLDANYVCKLGDFGICRLIQNVNNVNMKTSTITPDEQITLFHLTQAAKGTPAYMDPSYFATGELTTKSDVYSFGVILLRMLTGKPAKGIIQEVQDALSKGRFKELLDRSAGEWPFEPVTDLARLALRCCDRDRKSRPELGGSFWKDLAKILKSIKTKRIA